MDNIKILGFKASIDSVEDTLNLINTIKKDGEIIQILNADSIVSKNHIIHGVNQAFLAFGRNQNLANDIGVEIILRCSAQRQISKAFEILGLKQGNMNLCVVMVNCNDVSRFSSFFTLDDSVFKADFDYLKKIYNINDVELENNSMENIIIDRITKLIVDY